MLFRSVAHGAVDVGDRAARTAHHVVVVVADAGLVPRDRPAGLDAAHETNGGQRAQDVVDGLVQRIQPRGTVARYEMRVGDNHHHVVCRRCGAIADVDCAVGEAPCLVAGDDAGFAIDEAEVVYWGTCPDCAAAPTTP